MKQYSLPQLNVLFRLKGFRSPAFDLENFVPGNVIFPQLKRNFVPETFVLRVFVPMWTFVPRKTFVPRRTFVFRTLAP